MSSRTRPAIPLNLRNGIVPLAAWGTEPVVDPDCPGFWPTSLNLILVGIAAFSLTVAFQFVNLPVEFDASRRARQVLHSLGLVTPAEEPVVRQVLSAAGDDLRGRDLDQRPDAALLPVPRRRVRLARSGISLTGRGGRVLELLNTVGGSA